MTEACHHGSSGCAPDADQGEDEEIHLSCTLQQGRTTHSYWWPNSVSQQLPKKDLLQDKKNDHPC